MVLSLNMLSSCFNAWARGNSTPGLLPPSILGVPSCLRRHGRQVTAQPVVNGKQLAGIFVLDMAGPYPGHDVAPRVEILEDFEQLTKLRRAAGSVVGALCVVV